jgi:hypothetical protein
MLVNLTAQTWLDGADRPRPRISARNDVADDALPQGTSPVMAQIDRKVLPLHTRFSQHMAAEHPRFIGQRSSCSGRYRRHACISGRAHPCA